MIAKIILHAIFRELRLVITCMHDEKLKNKARTANLVHGILGQDIDMYIYMHSFGQGIIKALNEDLSGMFCWHAWQRSKTCVNMQITSVKVLMSHESTR